MGGEMTQTLYAHMNKIKTKKKKKQHRLRVGTGQQINIPEELLAPSRDQERHKG
jgi:hypothetical protein